MIVNQSAVTAAIALLRLNCQTALAGIILGFYACGTVMLPSMFWDVVYIVVSTGRYIFMCCCTPDVLPD